MKIPSEVGIKFIDAMQKICAQDMTLVVRGRKTNAGSSKWVAYLGETSRTSAARYRAIHADYYWAIIKLAEQL